MRYLLTAALCSIMLAAPPVSRPLDQVSAYNGKVVLVQYMFTTCQHCQQSARLYAKLQQELGPNGFQVVGIAFNDEVQNAPAVLQNFVKQNSLNFPVEAATRQAALNQLGLSQMVMLRVPQIMIIDRKGAVRVQSQAQGSPELQDEAHLRPLLNGLLKESK